MLMPFALGALCAAAVSGAQGWWLDSVRGIVLTSGLLFAIALVVTRRANQQILAGAAALWMGHRIADIVVLFVHGPGNLWPIVLGLGGFITAMAIAVPAAVNTVIRYNRQNRQA